MATSNHDRRLENLAPSTRELCEILLASLTALAEAGQTEAACRFAGRACATLRKNDPDLWRRFNGLLHILSPRTLPVGERIHQVRGQSHDHPIRKDTTHE